jgi:DNA-directed RNA polymerase specialized sigma24 family protein
MCILDRIQLLPAHESAVGDETTQVANREVLSRAFRHLSIDHRATLVLRHYLGLTVPDVAVAMAVPLGTAKSRLHHAERALRAALEADERSDRSSNEWWSA